MTEILPEKTAQIQNPSLPPNAPVMAKDSYYLSRLAQQLKQIKDKESEDYTSRFDRYQKQLKHSQDRVQSRIASLPTIHLSRGDRLRQNHPVT